MESACVLFAKFVSTCSSFPTSKVFFVKLSNIIEIDAIYHYLFLALLKLVLSPKVVKVWKKPAMHMIRVKEFTVA